MMNELLTILQSANENYICSYDEAHAMNVKADQINRNKGFAYIEEYRNGTHDYSKFVPKEVTNVSIYFCRLCEYTNDAIERESIISQIKGEIVVPFEIAYNNSKIFEPCTTFNWRTITPADSQFDANEVGIVLTFQAVQLSTCIDNQGGWNEI